MWSEVEIYTFSIAGEEGDIVAKGGEQYTVFTINVKMGDTGVETDTLSKLQVSRGEKGGDLPS